MLLLQFKDSQGERRIGILESDGNQIRVIDGSSIDLRTGLCGDPAKARVEEKLRWKCWAKA